MFIISIASVSATDVSDISDNQDSNILNDVDSGSGISTSDDFVENGTGSVGSSISSSSDSLSSSTGVDVSDYDGNSIDSIGSTGSDSNSCEISSKDGFSSTNELCSSTEGNAEANVSSDVLCSSEDGEKDSVSALASSASEKNSSVIESSSTSVARGDYYNVTLRDGNSGNPLAGKTITFTFNGNKYTKTTNSKGVASLLLNSSPGTYVILYSYAGDSNYGNYSNSQSIKIVKTPTALVNSGSSVVNGKAYYITLKDSYGNVLSGKTVSLTFNGKTYKKTTNSNGKVSLTISGTVAKTYKLTYKYAGDANYSSIAGSASIKIKMPTALSGSGSTIIKGKYYYITLKNGNGKVLSGKSVVFSVNGKNYTKTTNSKGVASLKINLKSNNTYTLTYRYDGSSYYGSSSKTVSLFVKTPTQFVNSGSSIANGKTYYITLKDSDGNVLAGKTVKITYRGKTYTKTTDSKGKVGLKISSTIGYTYKISYKYAGNSKYGAISGSVNLKIKKGTSLTGSSSTTIIKGNKYSVTLKDSSGKALSSKKVTFTFSGKNYTRTTNSKGVASLTIKAAAGKTYSFSYKYAGSSYYGSSSKTVSLFVKTPTQFVNSGSSIAKGKTYYITLKDSDGNVLAGKTVKITYRGKTYTKTTDSKGKVGLKISSTIGYTYKISYKYAGNSKYGAISGSVNLKIKKGTSLTGSSSTTIIKGNKYSVTLKDSSGKALSSKKVTFTFSGKNYTRTTNSKGVASLTIKAAAGKTYSFSYKYAGSSYYAASSSGTIKLSVKIKSVISNSGSSIMNGSNYKIALKDSNGNPLSNKKIAFTFNGKSYTETTSSNGVASLSINVSTPKKYSLTYKFGGDNTYTSSSGSVSLNVKSESVFTVAQVVSASSTVKSYVEKYGKVPSTVSVNGVSLNISSFTYLMGKAVVSINSGKTSGVITLGNISSSYSNGGSTSIKGNLTKANYLSLANSLVSYANSNSRIPNYINTSLGLVSPKLYSFGLSKVLVFYSSNNRLPNTLSLLSNEVDGSGSSASSSSVTKKGNSSQYKTGLNEITNLTAAQLKSYLTASGNDAINSAIKSLASKLVSGKTTTWAKAEAIYNYVRDNISYSFYSNSKKAASGTLSSKSANCCDQANLIVALCRAANIPARFSHAQGCTFSSGLVTGHVWAQIYVDGIWYSADATSSRNSLGNIKNWNVKSFSSLKQYAHLSF